jgi:DNA-binding LacI/PurR family transcriptional regulator
VFDSIVVDNKGGAFAAVRHLLLLGHRRIGFIGGPSENQASNERRAGMLAAFERHHRRFERDLYFEGKFDIGSGYDGTLHFFTAPRPPTAVFAANNLMAVGVLKAISQLGLKVPKEVSVVAFDDMDWFPLARPPITAVAQPAFDIGAEAARRLTRRLSREPPARPRRVALGTELIVRGSTCPPGRARRAR